jgi:hypothetical protein
VSRPLPDRDELERERERLSALDPMDRLRLGAKVTRSDIRHAFAAAARDVHPDRFRKRAPELAPLALEVYLLLVEAERQLFARRRASH